jgi:Na+/H+-dicarboxylate symporter
MLKKMPFIIVFVILAVLCTGPFLPLVAKQAIYTLSVCIKSAMGMLLPFIIFGLLFTAFGRFTNGATTLIALILSLVCVSNFAAAFVAHYAGEWAFNHLNMTNLAPDTQQEQQVLQPLFTLTLPRLIGTSKAMLAGMILGVIAPKVFSEATAKATVVIEKVVNAMILGFVATVPLFIAGFVVKLQYDGMIALVAKDYASIMMVVVTAQVVYLFLFYFILDNCNFQKTFISLKNMVPAGISGFVTMSSAVTMPLTIMGTEKNVKDSNLVRSVIPATVNIHLIGNCFTAVILVYAVLKSFGMPVPSLTAFVVFSLYFVMSKFSVVAVPGGGVAALLPLLEAHLGFKEDMISLFTAVYLLFEPLITCGSVMGNGAFAKLIDRCARTFIKEGGEKASGGDGA